MEELTQEDQAILMAVENLSASNPESTALEAHLAADPVAQAMVREYTEVLGLLAYELEPLKPSLSTKVRILGAVTGQTSLPVTPLYPQPVEASSPDRSFDEMTFRAAVSPQESVAHPTPPHHVPPQQPALQGQRFDPAHAPEPAEMTLRHSNMLGDPQAFQPLPAARTTSYGSWLLAAMLGVCLVGLGYFYGQVKDRDATIERLQNVASTLPIQSAELQNLRDELATVKRRFYMVTRVARAAYPIHTMGHEGGEDEVGKIYVCGAHQRWYLNLETLAPPPAGQMYYLWFMTADGPVSGGPVRVNDNATAEMDALTMPPGTKGFTVTLEEADAEPQEPAGTMVLLGEEKISL